MFVKLSKDDIQVVKYLTRRLQKLMSRRGATENEVIQEIRANKLLEKVTGVKRMKFIYDEKFTKREKR